MTAADAETVFHELAARLGRFVPFDASLFFATDPVTVLAVCPARIDGVATTGATTTGSVSSSSRT